MNLSIENLNAQRVTPADGKNPRTLYEHQIDAMKSMDIINKRSVFRTMLVLPTGGGKTLTAVYWLLKNAVDKGKKVLWIAHRHLLLEQAAEAFALNAYTDIMVNRTAFNYRIISGTHDRPVHIKDSDNVLIASKDSIIRSLDYLKEWLGGEDVFLVIDEAHHAVARSYKKIIDYVFDNAANTKLLGLTATPFRTAENEQGALRQIFTDDIVYKTDLDTLIKKGILATPVCRDIETDILLGDKLGLSAIKSIENLDVIPEEVAAEIADNSERNNLIVNKYLEDRDTYGPTIVFALNQNHAIALNALFNAKGKKYGIRSEYIISGVRDAITGVTISTEDNNRKIEMYRKGEIQVLINVNILTEGTDLPKTHTVFLTRPTVSTVLMTQMIGRALRGPRAGGTKEAYIVSFVDGWSSKIAWINPQTLTSGDYAASEDSTKRRIHEMRMIAISKLEELALIADESVDTSRLESIPAIDRIPLGMYMFCFTDIVGEQSMERHHQILVYSSTKDAYESLIRDLPAMIEAYGISAEEGIAEDKLDRILTVCRECYFDDNMVPEYNPKDIECLIKFFAFVSEGVEPRFVTVDELDRKALDPATIAKHIYDENMRRSEETEYVRSLWDEPDSIFPVYYSNFLFFKRMIQIEMDKLDGDIQKVSMKPVSEPEMREVSRLTLEAIIRRYPEYGIKLKESVYSASMDSDGMYVCAECGYKAKTREYLQIDHIKPMAHGGLTVFENLQVLCRNCNARKSDK